MNIEKVSQKSTDPTLVTVKSGDFEGYVNVDDVKPVIADPVDYFLGAGAEDLHTLRADTIQKVGEFFRIEYNPEGHDKEGLDDGHRRAEKLLGDIESYHITEKYSLQNEPEAMKARILDAINKRFSQRDKVTTLSKAIDRYGLNLKLIRSYNLAPTDEMALLCATAYAGTSRQTDAGTKLSKEARRILKHENSNTFSNWNQLQSNPGKKNEAKVLDTMHRSWLAAQAFNILDIVDALHLVDEAPVVSIDTVFSIIAKQRFVGDDSIENDLRKASGIEELDLYDENEEPIQTIPEKDLAQRLTNISSIEHILYDKFGADIGIKYKELSLSLDKTTRDSYEPSNRQTSGVEKDQAEPSERSSDFSGYTFIEITKPNGEIYVIADSPDQGNACYIVRSDIMAEMSTLLDKVVTWEDVLKYPKETARQLGAARFYHSANSDTLERAIKNIECSPNRFLKDIAEKWINIDHCAFDAGMSPTIYNRLPEVMRIMVTERPNEVKSILLAWLDQEDISTNPRATRAIGNKAVIDTLASSEPTDLDHLQAELIQKDIEIARLNDINQEQQKEIEKLKAMLRLAID